MSKYKIVKSVRLPERIKTGPEPKYPFLEEKMLQDGASFFVESKDASVEAVRMAACHASKKPEAKRAQIRFSVRKEGNGARVYAVHKPRRGRPAKAEGTAAETTAPAA